MIVFVLEPVCPAYSEVVIASLSKHLMAIPMPEHQL